MRNTSKMKEMGMTYNLDMNPADSLRLARYVSVICPERGTDLHISGSSVSGKGVAARGGTGSVRPTKRETDAMTVG